MGTNYTGKAYKNPVQNYFVNYTSIKWEKKPPNTKQRRPLKEHIKSFLPCCWEVRSLQGLCTAKQLNTELRKRQTNALLVSEGLENGQRVRRQATEHLRRRIHTGGYHCRCGICNEDLRPWREVLEVETSLGTAWPHIVPPGDECYW